MSKEAAQKFAYVEFETSEAASLALKDKKLNMYVAEIKNKEERAQELAEI